MPRSKKVRPTFQKAILGLRNDALKRRDDSRDIDKLPTRLRPEFIEGPWRDEGREKTPSGNV